MEVPYYIFLIQWVVRCGECYATVATVRKPSFCGTAMGKNTMTDFWKKEL